MKRWVIFAAVLLLAVTFSPCVGASSPGVSAASAIVYEPTGGQILYEKAAHVRRPMASTTKLMTALLGIESGDPDRIVTVPTEAVYVEGSSMGLRGGDRITMRDLVTGMLLTSGNDAANAVACVTAGSVDAFVERMNACAASLGMHDTVFETPSGLDKGAHGSTAYDMALLAAAVLKNADLAAICRMKSATVSFGDPPKRYTFYNHNKLLSLSEECIGLKTGFTKKAGRCLVSAAEREGMTVIVVTLKAPDDWNDHQSLYRFGFSQLERVTPVLSLPSAIPVYGGTASSVAILPPEMPAFTVKKGAAVTLSVRCASYLWAPVSAGEKIGEVAASVDGKRVAVFPVVAADAVPANPVPPRYVRFYRGFRRLIKQLLQ